MPNQSERVLLAFLIPELLALVAALVLLSGTLSRME